MAAPTVSAAHIGFTYGVSPYARQDGDDNTKAAAKEKTRQAYELKLEERLCKKAKKERLAGSSTIQKRSQWRKFGEVLSGSRSAAVMHRGMTESSQHITISIIRQVHALRKKLLAENPNQTIDDAKLFEEVIHSDRTQRLWSREDYKRYRRCVMNALGKNEGRDDPATTGETNEADSTEAASGAGTSDSKEAGKKKSKAPRRNSIAQALTIVGQFFGGICEVCAAPTGFTSKFARNATTRKGAARENSLASKLAYCVFLLPIAVATGAFLFVTRSAIKEGVDNSVAGDFLQTFLTAVAVCFPALSSLTGGIAAICGIASENLCKPVKLDEACKNLMIKEGQTTLHRLTAFAHKIASCDVSREMALARLYKEIPTTFHDDHYYPIILTEILKAAGLERDEDGNFKAENYKPRPDAEIYERLQEVIATYDGGQKNIDLSKLSDRDARKVETVLASHIVTVMNLVEHVDFADDLGTTKPATLCSKDGRMLLEERTKKNINKFLVRKIAKGLDYFNHKWSRKFLYYNSDAYLDRYKNELANPTLKNKYRTNHDYMQANLHEYGPITRHLIKQSENCANIANFIILARNHQISRFFNRIARECNEKVSAEPISRSICYSMGRFFGGAVLAVLWAATMGGLSFLTDGNHVVQQSNPTSSAERLNLASTGAMMFMFFLPSAILALAAKAMVHIEGWNPSQINNGRALSKRQLEKAEKRQKERKEQIQKATPDNRPKAVHMIDLQAKFTRAAAPIYKPQLAAPAA